MEKSTDEILELIFDHLIKGHRFIWEMFERQHHLTINYPQKKIIKQIVSKYTETHYEMGQDDGLKLTKEAMELFKIHNSYSDYLRHSKLVIKNVSNERVNKIVAMVTAILTILISIYALIITDKATKLESIIQVQKEIIDSLQRFNHQ